MGNIDFVWARGLFIGGSNAFFGLEYHSSLSPVTREGDLNATWEPEWGESESDAMVGVIPRSYLEEVNTIRLTECRHYIHYIHSALLYWIHQKPVRVWRTKSIVIISTVWYGWKSVKSIPTKISFVNILSSSANNEVWSDVYIKYDLRLNNTKKCRALYKILNLKYAYCILIPAMIFPPTVCCPPRFLTHIKYFRPIFADYLMSGGRGGPWLHCWHLTVMTSSHVTVHWGGDNL